MNANQETGIREQETTLTVNEPVCEFTAPLRRVFDMSLAEKLTQDKPEPIRRKAVGFMPLQGQLLVRLCTLEETSESGLIILPQVGQEKPVEGVVIAASRGRLDRNGVWVASEVQEGDRVVFGKYSGAKLTLRGEEMRMMREDELLGVIR